MLRRSGSTSRGDWIEPVSPVPILSSGWPDGRSPPRIGRDMGWASDYRWQLAELRDMTIRRLEALLGCTLSDAEEKNLGFLVTDRVSEDTDLDYKESHYGNGDSDKRELAGDLASFANTGGGTIVLGIAEAADGSASALTPVEINDERDRWIRQVAASNVSPHIDFDTLHIPSENDSESGYILIVVPASVWAPHAVRVGPALRYPRRHGTTRRWLSESEVADAYRTRFRGEQNQVERLRTIEEAGLQELAEPEDHAWLTLSTVPNRPGEFDLTRASVLQLAGFNRDVDRPHFADSLLSRDHGQPEVGYRRAVLALGRRSDGRLRNGVIHLHQDGSSFVGVRMGRRTRADETTLDHVLIDDEWLSQEVLDSVSIAAAHAAGTCGTTGDAVMSITIACPWELVLSHGRDGFEGTWTDFTIAAKPKGARTISLDEAFVPGSGKVAAAALLLSDLVQTLGVANSPQLAPSGEVRIRYYSSNRQQHVTEEAKRTGIHVSDQTI
jgi:schlafen family protein